MLTLPVSIPPRPFAARLQALASTLAGKPVFWLVFIVTMFTWPIVRSIQAVGDLPRNRPVLGQVRDFALRDQNGREFGAAELRGRIWVASFSSVECDPPCTTSQRMLAKTAAVRHRTRQLGDAVRLVTFVVDPDGATPEQMSELSASYRANRGSWHFVSGPPARVRAVLRDFQVAEEVLQARLALVDGNMLIRGFYDIADEAALHVLLRDIGLLSSLEGQERLTGRHLNTGS